VQSEAATLLVALESILEESRSYGGWQSAQIEQIAREAIVQATVRQVKREGSTVGAGAPGH
jgi:hypothetical protein